jgi:hypothetical protein
MTSGFFQTHCFCFPDIQNKLSAASKPGFHLQAVARAAQHTVADFRPWTKEEKTHAR